MDVVDRCSESRMVLVRLGDSGLNSYTMWIPEELAKAINDMKLSASSRSLPLQLRLRILLQLAIRSLRLDLAPATVGLRGTCGNQCVRLLAGEHAGGRIRGRHRDAIAARASRDDDSYNSSCSGEDSGNEKSSASPEAALFPRMDPQKLSPSRFRAGIGGSDSDGSGHSPELSPRGRLGSEVPREGDSLATPVARPLDEFYWPGSKARMRSVPGSDSVSMLAGRVMAGSGAVGLGVPTGLPPEHARRSGVGAMLACGALLLPRETNSNSRGPEGVSSRDAGTPSSDPGIVLGPGLQPWSRGGRRNLILAPTPGMACAAVQAGLVAKGAEEEKVGVAVNMGVASEKDVVRWIATLLQAEDFQALLKEHGARNEGAASGAGASPRTGGYSGEKASDAGSRAAASRIGTRSADDLVDAVQRRVGLTARESVLDPEELRSADGSSLVADIGASRGSSVLASTVRRSVSRQVRLSVGSRRRRRESLVGARVRVLWSSDQRHYIGRVVEFCAEDGSHVVRFTSDSGGPPPPVAADGASDHSEEVEESYSYFLQDRDYSIVEEFHDSPVGKDVASAAGGAAPLPKVTRNRGRTASHGSDVGSEPELAHGVVFAAEPTGHALVGRSVAIEVGAKLFSLADIERYDHTAGKHRLVFHNKTKYGPVWVDLGAHSYRSTVSFAALATALSPGLDATCGVGGSLAPYGITRLIHEQLHIFAGRRIWLHDSQSSRLRLAAFSGLCPSPLCALAGPPEATVEGDGMSSPANSCPAGYIDWCEAVSVAAVALHSFFWLGNDASLRVVDDCLSSLLAHPEPGKPTPHVQFLRSVRTLLDLLGSSALVASLMSRIGVDGGSPAKSAVLDAARAIQGLQLHLSRSFVATQRMTGGANGKTTSVSAGKAVADPYYIPVPGGDETCAGTLRELLAGAVAFITVEGGGSMIVPLATVQACWAAEVSTGRKPRPGATGLVNLGNSCYMSAAVQALSHCMPLAEYCSGVHGPLRVTMPKSANALASGLLPARSMRAGDGAMMGRFAAAFYQFLVVSWIEFSSGYDPRQEEDSARDWAAWIQRDVMSALPSAWRLALPVVRADEAAERVYLAEKAIEAGDVAAAKPARRHYGFRSFAPSLLKGVLGERRPAFDSAQQYDGHEAFTELLDVLHEELAVEHEEQRVKTEPTVSSDSKHGPASEAPPQHKVVLRYRSVVRDLFFVRTVTESRCLACSHRQRIEGPEDGEMLPPLPIPSSPVGSMRWRGGVDSALAYDELGVTGTDKQQDASMSFGYARRHRFRITQMRKAGDGNKLRIGTQTVASGSSNDRATAGPAGSDAKPWWLLRKYDAYPTVEDCLRSYFREAPLGSTFQCEACKARGVVVGRPYLASLPPVLAVMLKRFEFVFTADGGAAMVKKATPVLFDAGGGKPPSKRKDRGHGERARPLDEYSLPSADSDQRRAVVIDPTSAASDMALHMTAFVHPDFADSLHPGRPYGVLRAQLDGFEAIRPRRPSFTGSVAGDVESVHRNGQDDRSTLRSPAASASSLSKLSRGAISDSDARVQPTAIGRAALSDAPLGDVASAARARLRGTGGVRDQADRSAHLPEARSSDSVPQDRRLARSGRTSSAETSYHSAVRKVIESVRYNLFGLICHSGSMDGGHYTTYARPSHPTSPLFDSTGINSAAGVYPGSHGSPRSSSPPTASSRPGLPCRAAGAKVGLLRMAVKQSHQAAIREQDSDTKGGVEEYSFSSEGGSDGDPAPDGAHSPPGRSSVDPSPLLTPMLGPSTIPGLESRDESSPTHSQHPKHLPLAGVSDAQDGRGPEGAGGGCDGVRSPPAGASSGGQAVSGGVTGTGPVVVLSGSDPNGDGLGADGTMRRNRTISLTPLSPALPPTQYGAPGAGARGACNGALNASPVPRLRLPPAREAVDRSPEPLQRSPRDSASVSSTSPLVRAARSNAGSSSSPPPPELLVRSKSRARAQTDSSVGKRSPGPLDDSRILGSGAPRLPGRPDYHWVFFDDANTIPVEARRVSRPSTHKSAYMLLFSRDTTPATSRRSAAERRVLALGAAAGERWRASSDAGAGAGASADTVRATDRAHDPLLQVNASAVSSGPVLGVESRSTSTTGPKLRPKAKTRNRTGDDEAAGGADSRSMSKEGSRYFGTINPMAIRPDHKIG